MSLRADALPSEPAEVERLATLGAAALELANRLQRSPDRLMYTLDEAAASLGMSRDSFDRHVRPDLKIVRVGGSNSPGARCKRFVPLKELDRWIDENAAAAKP